MVLDYHIGVCKGRQVLLERTVAVHSCPFLRMGNMSGRHFRDYHLLLDEHSQQIFAMTDDIAERARKIGGATLRFISDIARHQRLQDNNNACVTPKDMLVELCADNQQLTRFLRFTHEVKETPGEGDSR